MPTPIPFLSPWHLIVWCTNMAWHGYRTVFWTNWPCPHWWHRSRLYTVLSRKQHMLEVAIRILYWQRRVEWWWWEAVNMQNLWRSAKYWSMDLWIYWSTVMCYSYSCSFRFVSWMQSANAFVPHRGCYVLCGTMTIENRQSLHCWLLTVPLQVLQLMVDALFVL